MSDGSAWRDIEAGDAAVPAIAMENVPRRFLSWGFRGDPSKPCQPKGHQACLHAGSKITASWTTDQLCNDVVIADKLDVFRWRCIPMQGALRIESTGFRRNRGLAHLVTLSGWKQNRLMLSNKSGRLIASSPSAVWFSDTVEAAPPVNSDGHIVITDSSKIYVIATDVSLSGISIEADSVGLAVLDDATVTDDGSGAPLCGSQRCLLLTKDAREYLWLEGRFDGAGVASYGAHLKNLSYSRLHRLRLTKTSTHGLLVSMLTNSTVSELSQAQSNVGVSIRGALDTRWRSVHVAANSGTGMELDGDISGTRIYELITNNNRSLGLFVGCGVSDTLFSSIVIFCQ
jgi:hypothetical protein